MNELIAWIKNLIAPKCPVCDKRMYRGKCPWRFTDRHKERSDG